MSAPTTGRVEARIVLIDDTPDFRLLLNLALEPYPGYRVVAEASDGARGIEVVQQYQPDVVLLDLAMPVMDGLEALPRIRECCPNARVIVLSGFEDARMSRSAVDAGASAYLQKGASPDEVVAAISAALGCEPPSVRVVPHEPGPGTRESELDALKAALAIAAHELRSPSSILVGLTQALRKRMTSSATIGQQVEGAIDDLLDAIGRQARVLDRVTADLLATSQSERDSLPIDLQPMPLRPALRMIADVFGADVAVELDCPSDLLVLADRVRVQQMLTNLATNATKYGRPPFSVLASRNGERVELRVTDRGPGIPDAFVPQLFQRYARAPELCGSGVGLGLSVVKALAAAQGGDAWYEPNPGGGSRFCFSLCVPAAAEGAREEDSDAA